MKPYRTMAGLTVEESVSGRGHVAVSMFVKAASPEQLVLLAKQLLELAEELRKESKP